MTDPLSNLRRIMDRQSPPRRRISTLILLDHSHIRYIFPTIDAGVKALSLTSKYSSLWKRCEPVTWEGSCSDDSVNFDETHSSVASSNKSLTSAAPLNSRSMSTSSLVMSSLTSNRKLRRSSIASVSPLDDCETGTCGRNWEKDLAEWIHKRIGRSVQQLIGVDFRSISHETCQRLEDYLDDIGQHRVTDASAIIDRWLPAAGDSDDVMFPLENPIEYVARVQKRIAKTWPSIYVPEAEWLILSSDDEIAWLFDLQGYFKGSDNRVAAIVGPCTKLFVDKVPMNKITEALKTNAELVIRPYNECWSWMADLSGIVGVSENVSEAVHRALRGAKSVISSKCPTGRSQSRRDPDERAEMQELFEHESAMCCCFLHKVSPNKEDANIAGFIQDIRSTCDEFIKDRTLIKPLPLVPGIQKRGRQIGRKIIRSTSWYTKGVCHFARVISCRPLDCDHQADVCPYTLSVRAFLKMTNLQFPPDTTGHQLDSIVVRSVYWSAGAQPHRESGGLIGRHITQPFPRISANVSHCDKLECGNIVRFLHKDDMACENCLMVVSAGTKPVLSNSEQSNDQIPEQWLTFQPLTLVPFDVSTLDVSQMAKHELEMLNDYNALCYETLCSRLQGDGRSDVCSWLKLVTRPVGE